MGYCNICAEELKRPGAILISPPNKNGSCKKLHICTECYTDLINMIKEET